MGRSKKPTAKKTDSESDEGDHSKSVVFLSSSDDEEANMDLSMEIIQRARERELKRKRTKEGGAIPISYASSEDFQTNFDQNAVEEKKTKKKHKRKSKENKKIEEELQEAIETAVDASNKEEEHAGTTDSVVTEVNDISDNAVLRKLLRGPRYFDPGEKTSEACFNCGEEGHTAANCIMERRKRPCFVCGMFGHNAKHCTQGQDCFICKRRGHIAKNCPDKHSRTPQDSIICLRCGDLGHDMLSCKNGYAPHDLKEIQCYVCKNYGHLCCADFTDNGPKPVSCYNCAQSGHTGLGCAKPRGEMFDVESPTLCYKCGEEGHFARGCTKYSKFHSKAKHIKFDQWDDGFSTLSFVNENRDSLGYRSVPHDYGKANKKKKKLQDEDRWNTSGKSRVRGGWIIDAPADLPRRKHKSNSWKSPSTPVKKSHKVYSSASGGQNSGSRSPFKKRKSFLGTPNSNASTSGHHHGYSAARYGKSHDYDYYGRS